jgi:hypothetical protein
MSEYRGPAGAASLPGKGPDALARVLRGTLSKGHPCKAAFHASFQRSTSNRAFQIGVGTRCRAFPGILL